MLKGVNRQILEITNPESPYFEKIIFFVRPEGLKADKSDLYSEAEKLSHQSKKPPKTRRTAREKAETLVCIFLGLGAGVALTAIMGIIA